MQRCTIIKFLARDIHIWNENQNEMQTYVGFSMKNIDTEKYWNTEICNQK